jgi:zinc and cadmium transporter
MMHPLDIHWVYTFGSVVLVTGLSFTCMVALSVSPARLSRVVPYLVSLAAGALLGTAFGHLLPESIQQLGAGRTLSAALLASFALFFVLEKILGVWCSRGSEDCNDYHYHNHGKLPDRNRPRIANVLLGGAIHSFIDGMALATAYSAGTHLGLFATLAVLLHEGPHHIGDVGVLIHSGIPVARAVALNVMAGATAAVGALLVLVIGTQTTGLTAVLLPFTTANFLYIAASSLVPELQQERSLRRSLIQTGLFLIGSLFMFASSGFSDSQ